MAVAKVVGPDGEHEHQTLTVEVAGEERHEVAGGAVDPVEVLEDQDDRRFRRQVAEETQQQAEQARLAEAAAGVRRSSVSSPAAGPAPAARPAR